MGASVHAAINGAIMSCKHTDVVLVVILKLQENLISFVKTVSRNAHVMNMVRPMDT